MARAAATKEREGGGRPPRAAPQPAGEAYPSALVPVNHIEPAPRRVRGVFAGETVFDTHRALYVWETPRYPQYYIPLADVRGELLVPEAQTLATHRGTVQLHELRAGEVERPHAAKLVTDSPLKQLAGHVRFEWEALDAWFEEDEQVFVHPRSPYVRIDALRSSRAVRIELAGTMLAESGSPVSLFETGLPTRYYLDRTEVDFRHLTSTDTRTACPYKGVTSQYWSAQAGGALEVDVAWAYDFPTTQVAAIAGLVAFYNERVDIFLDGRLLSRPETASRSRSSSKLPRKER